MSGWMDLGDVETGRETDKAIEINIDGVFNDYWVWVPKSCLRSVTKGVFKIKQIKSWIVYKNNWQSFFHHKVRGI